MKNFKELNGDLKFSTWNTFDETLCKITVCQNETFLSDSKENVFEKFHKIMSIRTGEARRDNEAMIAYQWFSINVASLIVVTIKS